MKVENSLCCDKKDKVKVKKLYTISNELKLGKFFSITRLLTIKSLCRNSAIGNAFAIYMLNKKLHSKGLSPAQKKLVKTAISAINNHINRMKKGDDDALENLFCKIQKMNNKCETHCFGTEVRIISSSVAFFCELAINVVKQKYHNPATCYELAKQYAEIYDPRLGTGLTPKSAPLVGDIADFFAAM